MINVNVVGRRSEGATLLLGEGIWITQRHAGKWFLASHMTTNKVHFIQSDRIPSSPVLSRSSTVQNDSNAICLNRGHPDNKSVDIANGGMPGQARQLPNDINNSVTNYMANYMMKTSSEVVMLKTQSNKSTVIVNPFLIGMEN